MSKITLKGFIVVPADELDTVKAELDNHVQLTIAEEGCLVFEITQDQSNPNRFNVYEEFEDEQCFQAHQLRVRSSKWGAVTTNVERHYQVEGLSSDS